MLHLFSNIDEYDLQVTFEKICIGVFFMTLIYSRNLEEHLQHLEFVLEIMRENELYTNMKKCNFSRATVEYLGHIISRKGVKVDPEKIRE